MDRKDLQNILGDKWETKSKPIVDPFRVDSFERMQAKDTATCGLMGDEEPPRPPAEIKPV